uniref:Uncharacterized protein n=1 Tax=Anguilla anguilla TaxID=7936 RepID=A0A0E9V7M6_ANGAN
MLILSLTKITDTQSQCSYPSTSLLAQRYDRTACSPTLDRSHKQ